MSVRRTRYQAVSNVQVALNDVGPLEAAVAHRKQRIGGCAKPTLEDDQL
jgi:hypothetical protein